MVIILVATIIPIVIVIIILIVTIVVLKKKKKACFKEKYNVEEISIIEEEPKKGQSVENYEKHLNLL